MIIFFQKEVQPHPTGKVLIMFQCMALLSGGLWYRPCCSPAGRGLEERELLDFSWSCNWPQGTLKKRKKTMTESQCIDSSAEQPHKEK